MGVRGLRTFITENGLLKGYRLHDCTLVIDGLNLLMELVAKFQQSRGDRTHFGGDYCSFALYIEAFLDALEECRVTPVVVMDGATEDIKRPTLLRRFDESLKRAKEISEGKMAEDNNNRSKAGYSLLNSYMFVQVNATFFRPHTYFAFHPHRYFESGISPCTCPSSRRTTFCRRLPTT